MCVSFKTNEENAGEVLKGKAVTVGLWCVGVVGGHFVQTYILNLIVHHIVL